MIRLLVFALAVGVCQLPLWGQNEPDPLTVALPSLDTPAAPPVNEAPSSPISPMTTKDIEAKRAALRDSKGLSDEVRAQLDDLYAKSLDKLNDAAQIPAKIESLQAEIVGVADAVQMLEAASQLADVPTDDTTKQELPTVEAARATLQNADVALAQQKTLLQETTAELDRRSKRLQEIPALVSTCRATLADLVKQSQLPDAANDSSELNQAKKTLLWARQQYRQREVELLQQEVKTYEATARLQSLRRDAADRKLKSTQKRYDTAQVELSKAEKQLADQQAIEARRAAVNAHPAVLQAAKVNTELAEKNSHIVRDLETTRNELQQVEKQREELSEQYSETQKRAAASEFTQAIGLVLRGEQSQLPDTSRLYKRSALRHAELSELNLNSLEWETERRKIVDLDAAINRELALVETQVEAEQLADVQRELQQVFASRLRLYSDLVSNARTKLSRLAALTAAEDELAQVIDDHAAFISEQILWVRSTAVFTPALLQPTLAASKTILDREILKRTWTDLVNDLVNSPINLIVLIVPMWMLLMGQRMRRTIVAIGNEVSRANSVDYAPTLQTLLLTLCIAAPLPVIMSFIGWRLINASGLEFSVALGQTVLVASVGMLLLGFARQVCRSRGLGDCHFNWRPDVLSSIRKSIRLLQFACVPLASACLFTELLGDELVMSTVGRISLVLVLVKLALIRIKAYRGAGPITSQVKSLAKDSVLRHCYRACELLSVLAPAGLAIAALLGFHYTATRLTARMFATLAILGVLLCFHSLLMRWLLVVYRRVAIKRNRERREALAAAREAGDTERLETVSVESGMSLKLSDINQQAQNLLRLGATVVGFVAVAAIWHDLLPALSVINRVELWDDGISAIGEHGTIPQVNLGDLIIGLASVGLTIFACRNLPGLLDMTIFQRLPLDAGARYAASAMTRYSIIVIGVAMSFRQIGIGWASVQWLVAAMTVGLGFGLQEIFANFVSGIILLFERPIRIGDTVTIGSITGTVTRIRIRATTVLDWDNKELIVPNRDFVTGNLVNWTLSNPNLRLVVNVGVAYGSDTRLATDLLYQVAASVPQVLDDPSPVVVFSRFGDSSLDFELRVFVSGLTTFRTVKHDLHMAIDDAFRKHKIEIAFPQTDLNVRSLPMELINQLTSTRPRSAKAA